MQACGDLLGLLVGAQVEGLEEEKALLEARVKGLQAADMVSTLEKQVRHELHACTDVDARDTATVNCVSEIKCTHASAGCGRCMP